MVLEYILRLTIWFCRGKTEGDWASADGLELLATFGKGYCSEGFGLVGSAMG